MQSRFFLVSTIFTAMGEGEELEVYHVRNSGLRNMKCDVSTTANSVNPDIYVVVIETLIF